MLESFKRRSLIEFLLPTMDFSGSRQKRTHQDVEECDECLPISKRINRLHIEAQRRSQEEGRHELPQQYHEINSFDVNCEPSASWQFGVHSHTDLGDPLVSDRETHLNQHFSETKPGIFKVDYVEKRPIERPVIISWEQRNTTLLPEDLKNFFMTSNGFHLEWSVKMENGPLPIGCLHVNAIGQLTCLAQPSETVSQVTPSIQDLDFDSDGEKDNQDALSKPTFGGGLRIFELDSLDGLGKVCLVYYQPNDGPGEIKSEIWFLDRALCWHFIAATFMDYFRLMVMHLGLPHWLYAVTEIGLPPQSKQWFHLYVPTRLEIDAHPPQDLGSVNIVGLGLKVTFDPTKIFKGKNDRKKTTTGNNTTSGQNINQNQNRNKKPQVSSARSASLSGTKPLSSSPSSQLLVKSSR